MFIVCPHCTTSYAIDLATLGATGRTVRCSRCKEVWLAHPEDAVNTPAPLAAMADAGDGPLPDATETDWEALARGDDDEHPPQVDSPPLAAGWPDDAEDEMAGSELSETDSPRPWHRRLLKRPASSRTAGKAVFNLPAITAAMGALVIALIVWRADVVRLMPQTATFYKMAGLEVNLRGISFKDLKVATETVDGKPVLVIEGVIVSANKKPVELPRLRFSVRDAQDVEIYAWNAVLDQSVLKPGERTAFKSRLASPPAEGRNVDIRFFNRRDLNAGNA
ncbi:MJ0042-type zinc finger domain-containing protein [Bradyrhizobium sp. STM 3557]|uniref:MJ0042-type zinc finger domain-containing protein n=1 Tax=Bradyrhizobium sp. STM 3557 TaxID=578920 RepID=UPI00389083BA